MSETPRPPSRRWQVADGLFGLLFLYSAAMNLNDPDPWVWVVLYGAGAYGCVLAALGRLGFDMAAITAMLYGIGAVVVAYNATGGSQDMKGFPQVGIFKQELVRESLGLGLVAFWMVVISVRKWFEPEDE